jgi:hypothetical protein
MVRDLAVILGFLQSMSLVLPYDRFQTREIQIAMKGKTMNTMITPTQELRTSLTWWKQQFDQEHSLQAPFPDRTTPIQLTISTDASDEGYGALNHNTGETLQGHWRGNELNTRIEVKEMRAAALATMEWTAHLKDTRVKLLVDNSITVSYMNKAKGGRKNRLNSLMAQVWKRCRMNRIILDVEWISTHDNVIPDRLSRVHRSRNDYKLHPRIFKQACKRFKIKPTVDLFATRENKQKTAKFCSRFGSPGAWKTNTLTLTQQDMKGQTGWANPPWPIISSTISWIVDAKIPCLLLVPYWRSSPWWTSLKQHANRVVKLETAPGIFVNSSGQNMPKPRWNLALALFRPKAT